MFNFSFYELLILGVIALIVLGPEKLPKAIHTLGTYYAKFSRTVGTLKAEMEAELDLAETRQEMQKELEKIRQAEADMQKQMSQLRGSMKQFEDQQQASLHKNSEQAGNNAEAHPNAKFVPEATISSRQETSKKLNSTDKNKTTAVEAPTRPWENMWFLLGDYDKAKRLPPAPLVPNYKPTPLLNASTMTVHQTSSNLASDQVTS